MKTKLMVEFIAKQADRRLSRANSLLLDCISELERLAGAEPSMSDRQVLMEKTKEALMEFQALRDCLDALIK